MKQLRSSQSKLARVVRLMHPVAIALFLVVGVSHVKTVMRCAHALGVSPTDMFFRDLPVSETYSRAAVIGQLNALMAVFHAGMIIIVATLWYIAWKTAKMHGRILKSIENTKQTESGPRD